MSQRRYTTRAIYTRLLILARPYWLHVIGVFALHLLATPLKLLLPLPLALLVDNVLGDKPAPAWSAWFVTEPVPQTDSSLLAFAIVLLVVVGVLSYLNGLAIWLLHGYAAQRLTLEFRSRLFMHAQQLSLRFHDTRGTTDSLYRIHYDAPAIQWITFDGIIPFLAAGFTLVGMIYVTAMLDWMMALVALAVTPMLWVLTRIWGRRLRDQWEDAKELESSAMGAVQETLGSLRVVKAYGQEEREHDRFLDRATRGMWGQVRVSFSQGLFELLIGVVLTLGSAAALYLGVVHVQQGRLTLGELLLVWTYLTQLYGPLQVVSSKIGAIQGSLASAERALTLLDEAPEITERPHARSLKRATGRICFEDAWFEYRPGEPVLHGVTCEIPAGCKVGIAGPTGAGKSTMMNLLTRFYDPTRGRVLLDGIDLRELKLRDLREQFSIVLQEPVLFAAPIDENIAYSKPRATTDEVVNAAKAANAHDFITRLPEGYHTRLGERGLTLSGGERQRIALARAFLKDSPVLILDEPTSAVDVRTEAAIVDALHRLMSGRTTFMIAHRLSTLLRCDLLLIMERGKLVRVTTDVKEGLEQHFAPAATP